MSASELLGHPAFQLWAAALVPFACRFAAAWTMWQRLHGMWTPVIGNARDRIPPGRSRMTTDPIVAGIWWVIATLVASLVLWPLWSLVDELGTALPLPALLLAVSMAVSLLWLFRRIRADDVAWRAFRANAARSNPPDLP